MHPPTILSRVQKVVSEQSGVPLREVHAHSRIGTDLGIGRSRVGSADYGLLWEGFRAEFGINVPDSLFQPLDQLPDLTVLEMARRIECIPVPA